MLRKSIDVLDVEIRDRFAMLGVFAPKPAAFDIGAMSDVWETTDPLPTLQVLVDRGILEPTNIPEEFQMHGMLLSLARAMSEK